LGIARCEVLLGERDLNLEALRVVPEKNRFKLIEGFNSRILGGILLNLGGSEIAESEQWMQKAIEADARNGRRFDLGLDHALYGEFFKHKRNRVRAQEEYGKAIEILLECGADGFVTKCERELAAI
jgi:hypothetical protein